MTILFKVLDKKNKGRTPFTFARRVKKALHVRFAAVAPAHAGLLHTLAHFRSVPIGLHVC